MRIKVKEDTEDTKDTKDPEPKKEVTDIKKEGTRTDADGLFDPLQALVLEYLGDKNHLNDKEPLSHEKNHQGDDKDHLKDDKGHLDDAKNHLSDDKDRFDDDQKQTDIRESQSHPNSYKFQSRLTLLGNLTILYTNQIANNLLWHIDIDETLEFAASNPACLLITIEVKDPHGQRVRGTPLQIAAAAGDRNPRKLKPGEKDYGLVERLRFCFPKDSKEYDKQLEEWFRPDSKKEQTNKTMAPYVNAIKTLCQEIIASTEISEDEDEDVDFVELLMSPIAEKFRKALTPDPNHVVTSGFLFDLQIFLDFFEIWEANVNDDKVEDKKRPNLGAWFSIKSDVFVTIVYPALQARVQRIDLEVFNKGIGNVIDKAHLPNPINFSKGIPADSELGYSLFFQYHGLSCLASVGAVRAAALEPRVRPCFSNLMSSKNVVCWNYTAPSSSYRAGVRTQAIQRKSSQCRHLLQNI